ncbi:MAG: ribosome maturation factor RimM [Beutenbergiaceae bacterium]
MSTTEVRIATIGAAHGLHGDVKLRVHTDNPTHRLRVGATFTTEPAQAGPLVLARVVDHSGTTAVRFDGCSDRTAAEQLRGVVLLAPAEPEEDAWYPDQLVGLNAQRPDGRALGQIVAVQHSPAHDLLVLAEPNGQRTQIPFVSAIVPDVDIAAGIVVIDAPTGLLTLDTATGAGDP